MTTPKPPLGASPDTVAWRLGAVENELNSFKKEIVSKLDSMASGFATHKDIETVKEQGKLEHAAIYEKIADVEREVQSIKKRVWLQNTLSAVLGAVLTFLVVHFINNV